MIKEDMKDVGAMVIGAVALAWASLYLEHPGVYTGIALAIGFLFGYWIG